MNVFLTGGTGFIGQPLARTLRSRGWNVTALVRKPDSPQAQNLSKMGAQLSSGDVTERESMREAMDGAELVIHNAGQYEYGLSRAGKQRMRAVNVAGTDNVLGLALELGVPRAIHVSTVQAYGDSGSQLQDETFVRNAAYRTLYERTKTESHAMARRYQERGLPLIIVCPNGVVGPNDHSVLGYNLRLYINNRMLPVGWSPDSMYSLVDVNDLAEGITLAAEKGRAGETYLFCGESRSLREHFGYWERRPGGSAVRYWLPPWLFKLLFWPLEPLERAVGLPAFLSRETVNQASISFNYCSDKAKQELGWTHRSAEEMWLGTLDTEIELLAKRSKRDLVSLLNPIESFA